MKDADEQRRKQKDDFFYCKLNVPQARHTAKARHEHVKAFLTFSPGHQMAHREVLKKKNYFLLLYLSGFTKKPLSPTSLICHHPPEFLFSP